MKKTLTKILLSTIIFLISLILISYSDTKLFYQKYIFNDYIHFPKFYQKFNKIFKEPKLFKEEGISKEVFNDHISDNYQIEDYLNGKMIIYDTDIPVKTINSGIVVFIGEKENYGKTIIIQGIDGVDIWYGNVTDIGISLYDYVESNQIIANTNNKKIYLLLSQDNKYIDLEEYENNL